MGFYDNYILPKMVHCMCSMKPVMEQRQKVVPFAKGRVLEIGIGSGLNLPFYDSSNVDYVWGLDPSKRMKKMAEKHAANTQFEVEFLGLDGDEIPLDSNSANTILVTYTLCTIPDILQSLSEMRRILKNGGELIFCEHGLAPDENVHKWQNRMNPLWKRMGGGCNLNRPIPDLIEQGGFKITSLETEYINPLKPISFNYSGSAVIRD